MNMSGCVLLVLLLSQGREVYPPKRWLLFERMTVSVGPLLSQFLWKSKAENPSLHHTISFSPFPSDSSHSCLPLLLSSPFLLWCGWECIHCRLVQKLKPPIGQPFLDLVSKLNLINKAAAPGVQSVSPVQ